MQNYRPGGIAALGFGKLLMLSGMDSSREAYAFDVRGLMLSESRYEESLRRAGALPEGQPRLAVRDPGGDLLAGFRPATAGPERPLTRLGQAAIDGFRAGSVEGGVLLEPYRNYRGAEVIGAWRWLPQKELAVAVEIDAVEAYAPLQYLRVAFEVMFGFMFIALAGAGGMALWAVRLRLREAKHIGQYAIEREIGEGGMSHVYLARHPRLRRPTAVKVLKPHLASDEVVRRFERTAGPTGSAATRCSTSTPQRQRGPSPGRGAFKPAVSGGPCCGSRVAASVGASTTRSQSSGQQASRKRSGWNCSYPSFAR